MIKPSHYYDLSRHKLDTFYVIKIKPDFFKRNDLVMNKITCPVDAAICSLTNLYAQDYV